MAKRRSSMAQQVAQAASDFQALKTGHVPKVVTVVLSEDTLVATLYEALSPAEGALVQSPAGAAQVQEFRRHLSSNSSDSLRREIRRITGVGAREAARGGRDDFLDRGASLHHRRHGSGVPARPRCGCRRLERT